MKSAQKKKCLTGLKSILFFESDSYLNFIISESLCNASFFEPQRQGGHGDSQCASVYLCVLSVSVVQKIFNLNYFYLIETAFTFFNFTNIIFGFGGFFIPSPK